jgi:hypothetical protein
VRDLRIFPDWLTWVRAFGPDQCYISTPIGRLYNAAAVALWAGIKVSSWGGSCFGLAQLSMLGFDNPEACMAAYPDLGAFANLHDLTINNDRRNTINAVWSMQFGQANQAHMDSSVYLSPTITLQRCRAMLDTLSSSLATAAISFCHRSANDSGGCHTVTPIAVVKDTAASGAWLIMVYDNNYPDSVGLAIRVDTAFNIWTYDPFNWTNTNHLFS